MKKMKNANTFIDNIMFDIFYHADNILPRSTYKNAFDFEISIRAIDSNLLCDNICLKHI